jgi:hypothetical protein
MLTRLALAAALASIPLPSLALAQSAPSSALCDGSEVHRAERIRGAGGAMFIGTAVVDVAAMLTIPRNPGGFGAARSHFRFVAATSPIALVGIVMARGVYPGEKFWERAIARMKVGETRSADVRVCLHRPDVATSHGHEQRWTYVTSRPTTLDGSLRVVRLVFRDSVLTDIERTEVNRYATAGWPHTSSDSRAPRRRAICIPAPTVFADPFPTPLDTSAASVAMARAQADADAAMKNAENAAAFAACLASDRE